MAGGRFVPQVHFARSSGGRLAWQTWGSGDEVIVAVPPAAQNIEVAWEWPEIRSMLERFGTFARYLHYDKRGTGASDRGDVVPGLDERVEDLRAVMDAADVDRAHLFAQSEGGPTTLLFAATHPHRVRSLVMHGTAAYVATAAEAADPQFRRVQTLKRREFADRWGTPDSMSIELFAPSRAGDRAFVEWFQRYERLSATSDGVFDLMMQMLDMDVSDVVPGIEVPVLVLHRTGDRSIPIESARELAALAPHSTMVELEGDDHYAFLGDVEEWMRHVERWVTGSVDPDRPRPARPTRVEIQTLGRFAVLIDGTEVETAEWGSRRARVLLKRLIVAEGRPVTRDELFDVLWPDESDRSRLGARLSVQLSAVRRILGGGVVADRETVALDLDRVGVDLVTYLDAVDRGDDDAIVSAHGDFLPEHVHDDWASPMRERVRSAFTVAAHRLLTGAIDADEHDRAIELARSISTADPFDDLAWASLIDALDASGDPAAARRARAERAARLGDDA